MRRIAAVAAQEIASAEVKTIDHFAIAGSGAPSKAKSSQLTIP